MFNEDNFYIPQFEYRDTRLSMVFAVVSDVNGVMTRQSVEAALKNFGDSLENELQLKIILNLDYLNNKLFVKKSKSNSVVITAIVCLFIMMGILVMLFIFVKNKRR